MNQNKHLKILIIATIGIASSMFLPVSAIAQTWIQQFPAGTPPTDRYISSNAYDEGNDRLILFSGEVPAHPRPSDVWVLTNATAAGGGQSWIQLFPTGTAPAGRLAGSAVYDSQNNRLIIHGGCLGHCLPVVNDTWVLTNANGLGGIPTWIPLPSAPIVRDAHIAAYDANSNRMIVFGGNTGIIGGDRNDVWILTDANGIGSPSWLQLFPTGTPPAGRGASSGTAGVYDAISNRLIIFGGKATTGAEFNDVWVLSNANGLGGTPHWTQLFPSGTPPAPRTGHSMSYDLVQNRVVIIGGASFISGSFFNDVWTLTNANGLGGTPQWVQLAPTGGPPAGRLGHASGYSPTTKNAVIVMGRNDTLASGLVSDVWVLADATGVVEVNIDIKPGSDPNCFNNDGHGVIPVAILTTDTFDASEVDPFSVALDGMSVRVKGKSGNAGSLEDVDGDGDLDLVVQIEDADGVYEQGDSVATLTGETIDGAPIEGTDSICIVP